MSAEADVEAGRVGEQKVVLDKISQVKDVVEDIKGVLEAEGEVSWLTIVRLYYDIC